MSHQEDAPEAEAVTAPRDGTTRKEALTATCPREFLPWTQKPQEERSTANFAGRALETGYKNVSLPSDLVAELLRSWAAWQVTAAGSTHAMCRSPGFLPTPS